jgi:hypothetical protein
MIVHVGNLDVFYEDFGELADEILEGDDTYFEEYPLIDPGLSHLLEDKVCETASTVGGHISSRTEYLPAIVAFHHGGFAEDVRDVLILTFATSAGLWSFIKIAKPLLLRWIQLREERSITIKIPGMEIVLTGRHNLDEALTLIDRALTAVGRDRHLQHSLSYVPSVSESRWENSIIGLLFVAANPQDSTRLRLDAEIREIDQALRLSEFRGRFDIEQHWAVRFRDLQSALLRHKPHIVHFSGHGTELSEIVLEDDQGHPYTVPPDVLARLFSLLKDNTRCVILNACYSEPQAEAIADHIDIVIGMRTAISDNGAISFAVAFYEALAYGRDVQTAFDLGCLRLSLEYPNEKDIPTLIAKKVNPSDITFV